MNDSMIMHTLLSIFLIFNTANKLKAVSHVTRPSAPQRTAVHVTKPAPKTIASSPIKAQPIRPIQQITKPAPAPQPKLAVNHSSQPAKKISTPAVAPQTSPRATAGTAKTGVPTITKAKVAPRPRPQTGFASKQPTMPQKPPHTSSSLPFEKNRPQTSDNNQSNYINQGATIIAVPVIVAGLADSMYPASQQEQSSDTNSQPVQANQADNNPQQNQGLNTSPDSQPNPTVVVVQQAPPAGQSLNTAISLTPQLNCPQMPTDTDKLNDSDYQKVMNKFRDDNFKTDLVNTQAKADNCQDQCKTEFPGKCYTGFTNPDNSGDNKCECATPK
ncbi:MAG: hypothetical protein P4L22_03940 [Candidatus Babeliales bacterium]|nr:hypothetical protein [Candidatus Babeliales bacterium]